MPEDEVIFYRRNLPHIHPRGGTFFITFRLAGSLPVHVLRKLQAEKESEIRSLQKQQSQREFEEEKYKIERRYFGKYDGLLDKFSHGPRWLGEERIARIVIEKLHECDGKRFRVICYCLMPNHVHLLIDMTGFYESAATNVAGKTRSYVLADALRLLKGSTARFCNLELGREGAFWHRESYDHYVRDSGELYRIIEYVLNNPVKAGMVEKWEDWKFNYLAELN